MVNDFVHINLGLDHVSRERIVDHQPQTFCKELFTDPISDTAILVLDETYISFCKFQRFKYSMHKKRPFVNSFITATYGYIEVVVGPFFANGRNNNASILSHIVKTNAGNFMEF